MNKTLHNDYVVLDQSQSKVQPLTLGDISHLVLMLHLLKLTTDFEGSL